MTTRDFLTQQFINHADDKSSDDKSSDMVTFMEEFSEDDQEEEEEDDDAYYLQTTQVVAAASALAATHCVLTFRRASMMTRSRFEMFTRNRVNWDEHVSDLLHEGLEFRQLYRMGVSLFNKLCNLIRPLVQINEEMSTRRTGKGPILPEKMLHCLIRYLAGSSCRDICLSVGMSLKSFYGVLYRCANAILRIDELGYHFPSSVEECYAVVSVFFATEVSVPSPSLF
jgi:hypothetical protein